MSFPKTIFPSELTATTRKELDIANARLKTMLKNQHKSNGDHGDITADSLTIEGDPPEISFVTKTVTGETEEAALTAQDGYVVVVTEFGEIHIGQRPVSLPVAGGTRFAGIVFDAGEFSGGGTTISYGFGSATSSESSPPSDAFGLYDVTNDVPLLRVWRDFQSIGAANYMIAPDFANAAPSLVYLGNRNSALTRFIEVAATTLYGTNGVQERGRTVSMGDWTTFFGTFSGNGAMTWTSVFETAMAYTLIGTTMTVSFHCNGTVGGTPNSLLRILIPASKTSTKYMNNAVIISDATNGLHSTIAQVVAGGNQITFYNIVAGAAVVWPAGAMSLFGQIAFEVDP